MQNARALDEKLRKIIREVSDNTGQEIKRNLLAELARTLTDCRSKEVKDFLDSLNQAVKKL